MLHLDFDFRIEPTRHVVVGWCDTECLNGLYLQGDDHIIFPLLVSDHPRRDLRSNDLRGFIAIFEVKAQSDLQRYEFRAEGEDSLFPIDDVAENFGLFVSKSVDETFWDFCLQVGCGEISIAGAALVSVMRPRIKSMIGNYAETQKMAGGMDLAVAAQASNVALLCGWTASDRANTSDHPLRRAGFALCENALVPLKMHWDCHLRPDLNTFGDRFSLTGSEGYVGTVHTNPDHGQIETLVVSARYRRGQFVLAREVEDVSFARMLVVVRQIEGQLSSPEFNADIREALRPNIKAIELNTDFTRTINDSRVTLVLEHDGQDSDIRDVLRHCHQEFGHGFDLIVINTSLSKATKRAIAAYQNEAAYTDMIVSCYAPDHPIDRWNIRGEIVVFARSSSIIQLAPFPDIKVLKLAKVSATVIVHDPILAIATKPNMAQLAKNLAARRMPMIAMINMSNLPAEPGHFVGLNSVDAQMRLLILSMWKAKRAQVTLATPAQFFDGMAGRQVDEEHGRKIFYDLLSLDSEAIAYAFAGVEYE